MRLKDCQLADGWCFLFKFSKLFFFHSCIDSVTYMLIQTDTFTKIKNFQSSNKVYILNFDTGLCNFICTTEK